MKGKCCLTEFAIPASSRQFYFLGRHGSASWQLTAKVRLPILPEKYIYRFLVLYFPRICACINNDAEGN
jgi:hypothetical protein